MTLPDGCVARGARRRRAGAAPRLDRAARGGRRPSAPATRSSPGYVAARYAGSPPTECLRFGVACGAESTQRLGAGLIDPREVERLLAEVEVQRLETPAEVP